MDEMRKSKKRIFDAGDYGGRFEISDNIFGKSCRICFETATIEIVANKPLVDDKTWNLFDSNEEAIQAAQQFAEEHLKRVIS